ncbi:DUF5915 domain-containing protein [Puia sp. P3]|uniref:DUF5915 domain-containing protein n=1 Tax=Puia sp. P3 TaxID=3423952 RepID=UPI003D67C0F1
MPGNHLPPHGPDLPFFSDWLFTNLEDATGRIKAASVHHADFPVANADFIDLPLEERMQMAQDASSLILSLRKKVNIKVRQPLQKVLIPVLNPGMKDQLEKVQDLIMAEVNVKEVQYLSGTDGFIKKKIKPNFIALGKKLGPKMKAVSTALAEFSQENIEKLEKEGNITLFIDKEPLILTINEVEITSEDIPGWVVANKNALTVALDVTVTPELAQEGNAREFVNRIQKIRKDNGYDLTDRILVKVADVPALSDSLNRFNEYICAEILADSIELVKEPANGTEIEVNDILLKVFVTKKPNCMATKKKAAKPAKKTATVKKVAPAKKSASKPAHSSGSGKAVKKAPVAKPLAKPVAKKVVAAPAVKKSAPVQTKKTAVSNISKATSVKVPPSVGKTPVPTAVSKTSATPAAAAKQSVTAPVVAKTVATPPPPPVAAIPPKAGTEETGCSTQTGEGSHPGNKDKNGSQIRAGIHKISIRHPARGTNWTHYEIQRRRTYRIQGFDQS